MRFLFILLIADRRMNKRYSKFRKGIKSSDKVPVGTGVGGRAALVIGCRSSAWYQRRVVLDTETSLWSLLLTFSIPNNRFRSFIPSTIKFCVGHSFHGKRVMPGAQWGILGGDGPSKNSSTSWRRSPLNWWRNKRLKPWWSDGCSTIWNNMNVWNGGEWRHNPRIFLIGITPALGTVVLGNQHGQVGFHLFRRHDADWKMEFTSRNFR